MLDLLEPSALLVDHLPWIDRVAAMVCRKNGVWGDDAEDFASLARMKVIEGDYAVLRGFRGECALKTYLATVVVQRFHEWVRERHGRWRPSAAAERAGPPASELEALVYRDGCTLSEAGERLRSGGRTTASDAELARILATLPARHPLRPTSVGEAPLALRPAAERADGAIVAAETRAEREVLVGALQRALGELEAEDALIVRLRYGDGRRVADIARGLGLDQRMLYRRLDRLRDRLRASLEAMGISAGQVRVALAPGNGEDEP
ncbi:MAG TPA: sigma-70 family RNA polymerase sigma factor [Longimicrobium sp.]|nr:sigma-70 family RNA polymerase sigma factor [Longimicrobium sp.]